MDTGVRRFVFHPDRCTGCGACAVGCWMEHRASQGEAWRQVLTHNPRRVPGVPTFHLSLACHHCEDPACLRHCPADAYQRDAATGAVILRQERCIGCRYCTWACPHDAPHFHAPRGLTEKCTFCHLRQAQGQDPACVARCPLGALGVEARTPGEADAPPPGFPESPLRPGIRFTPLRRGAPQSHPRPQGRLSPFLDLPARRITFRHEGALWGFTLTLALLVGSYTAFLAGGPRPPALPFLALGALALGASTAHLGRPLRAWRAILHLRTSWLSREVLLVGAFLGLSGLHLLANPAGGFLPWAALTTGWLGLLAIDRLYQVATQVSPLNLHSAQTLPTALLLTGLLQGQPLLWLPALAWKGVLLASRIRQGGRFSTRTVLRILLGFAAAPAAAATGHPVLALALALAGEALDRAQFYDDLEVTSPQVQLHRAVHPQ